MTLIKTKTNQQEKIITIKNEHPLQKKYPNKHNHYSLEDFFCFQALKCIFLVLGCVENSFSRPLVHKLCHSWIQEKLNFSVQTVHLSCSWIPAVISLFLDLITFIITSRNSMVYLMKYSRSFRLSFAY